MSCRTIGHPTANRQGASGTRYTRSTTRPGTGAPVRRRSSNDAAAMRRRKEATVTTHDTPQPGSVNATLTVGERTLPYFPLAAAGSGDHERLPYTVKVLLENLLRGAATQPGLVRADDVRALASWDPSAPGEAELPFMPARVILQDFTGVPCVVDLAAMRDASRRWGATRPDQPARARGPRDRPFRAGRPVRLGRRVPHQRRARVRAQRRALRAPALGTAGVRRLPGRAAGDGHRAPGQPRVPRRRRGAERDGVLAFPTRSSGPTRTRR